MEDAWERPTPGSNRRLRGRKAPVGEPTMAIVGNPESNRVQWYLLVGVHIGLLACN